MFLLNSIMVPKEENLKFLNKEDALAIIKHHRVITFFTLCYHELLGHGSGKIFILDENGELNFDKNSTKNPLTNENINSWYVGKENFFAKFSKYANAYE